MSKRNGILTIGNLIFDQSLHCNEYPKESMLTRISSMSQSCGGGCTNVLFDIATMDPELDLYLCGLIANDEYGDFILNEANLHNLDIKNVRVVESGTTSFTYVIVNGKNGYRTFFHNMGVNNEFNEKDFLNLKSNAKIAHVAYLMLLPALEQPDEEYGTKGAKALASLAQQGFKVSLDLVSVPEVERYKKWVIPALKHVDYLIINDEEAKRLTGHLTNGGFFEQAHALMCQGVKEFVCIHYPDGAIAVDRDGKEYKVSSYLVDEKDVVSALGAGDAFCAGMLYAVHQEYDLNDALRLGCASAHFNLYSYSATEGAKPLLHLKKLIEGGQCCTTENLSEKTGSANLSEDFLSKA